MNSCKQYTGNAKTVNSFVFININYSNKSMIKVFIGLFRVFKSRSGKDGGHSQKKKIEAI